jgi:alanine racemase
MSDIFRQTKAVINLDNISHNYNALQKKSEKTSLIPVVKADAYGHGAHAIVRHLYYNHDVRLFAVSLLEEALDLDALDLDLEILIMGPLDEPSLRIGADHGFIFTVASARIWEIVKSIEKPLRFHVKVDTGMHRLGLQEDTLIWEIFNYSKQRKNLNLEGIFTHFATADSDGVYFMKQKEAFNEVLRRLPYMPPIIHASNSSAVIKYERNLFHTTHARIGISLYGYSLEKDVSFLKPVMTLLSVVSEIKTLAVGEKLGYNITYEARENERIAILPIGYGDGMIRKNQGGLVSIGGANYSIVGRVCMDMMFVKVNKTVNEGDEVILFGENHLTADTIAKRTDTISYEVLCQVSKRVPRVYKK